MKNVHILPKYKQKKKNNNNNGDIHFMQSIILGKYIFFFCPRNYFTASKTNKQIFMAKQADLER